MSSLLLDLIGDGPEVAENGTFTDTGTVVGPSNPAFTETFEAGIVGGGIGGTVFADGANPFGYSVDTTNVYNGSKSFKFQTGSPNNSYATFGFGSSVTSFYVRTYFQMPLSNGVFNGPLGVLAAWVIAGAIRANVMINTSGQFVLYDALTAGPTTTGNYNTGNWYRLEWDVYTSIQELRIYNTTTGALLETLHATGQQGNAFDSIAIGSTDSSQPIYNSYGKYWLDDIAGDYSRNPSIATPITDNEAVTATDYAAVLLTPKSATETASFTDAVNLKAQSGYGETITGTEAVTTRTASVLSAETITSSEAGKYSTRELADNDPFTGTERDTPNRIAISKWRFTPPSTPDYFQVHPHAELFITMNEGLSVLKTAGVYTQVSSPLPEAMAAADIVYLGGRSYAVDDTEIAALTSAGYGAYLALVPEPS
jgi:hypothetical protein